MTFEPSELSTAKLYGMLSTAVAPRPIAFASTVDAGGRVNLSPFSYFNVFSTTPPILVFSPIRRGRDGSAKDTLNNILAVPEVVINIVNHPMVEQMSLTSTEYPTGTNEFVKAGFRAVPSEVVRPPRVGESPVSFECTVDQVVALGDGGGAGNLVICRVVRIHIAEAVLNADGDLDTHRLDLVARMGGNDYCHVTPESLFEIPKPLRTLGIGVDALPEQVRNSSVLTGNHLGRLGNLGAFPEPDFVERIRSSGEVQRARRRGTVHLHELARQWLEQDRVAEALAAML